jgi:hypothetical protein
VQTSRRSFLALIPATLAATVAASSISPQAAPAYRPYRIGASVVGVDDAQWGGRYSVSLWEGERFIKVVRPQYPGRRLVVPVAQGRGFVDCEFRYTGGDPRGLADFAAQYATGPKWWVA